VIVMEIPVRMRQTRTATETEESQSGLFCQATTTSSIASLRRGKRPRMIVSDNGTELISKCHPILAAGA